MTKCMLTNYFGSSSNISWSNQRLLLSGYDIDDFFFKICTTSGQISELNCDHINRDFSDFLFSVDRLAFPLLFKKGILNKSFIVLVQDQIF